MSFDRLKRNDKETYKIFLTGATGFIGAFLLSELLEYTDGVMYCLVRADNKESAMQRIIGNMKNYYTWKDGYEKRIELIPGDLSKPYLGLALEDFNRLSEEIDSVYHNGAFVNFLYSYDVLKGANVDGTREIIRLMETGSQKTLNFISSMNVFYANAVEDDGLIYEETIPAHEDKEYKAGMRMGIGYLKSKREAEHIINEARQRGVKANIYRLGQVSGHSITGACQKNDFFWRTVKASLKIGKWPDYETQVDLTPVDFVCKAIVHIGESKNTTGKNFHLYNKKTLPYQEIIHCMRGYGYEVDLCTYEEWLASFLRRKSVAPESNTAKKASPMINEKSEIRRFDDSNVSEALVGTGIECPPLDRNLMKTYFEYFRSIGYI